MDVKSPIHIEKACIGVLLCVADVTYSDSNNNNSVA
jgi:hypothetical protein